MAAGGAIVGLRWILSRANAPSHVRAQQAAIGSRAQGCVNSVGARRITNRWTRAAEEMADSRPLIALS